MSVIKEEELPETIEETTPVDEEVIVTDQTEQKYVIVDEPEKESLPIEEETTSLDEDENKESIELIEKEDFVPAV